MTRLSRFEVLPPGLAECDGVAAAGGVAVAVGSVRGV